MRAIRLSTDGPIIRPDMDERMGANINGPSLIRTPEWLPNRLGEFYLYFADHKGTYIRLAYADDVLGPWRTHEPGALQLQETSFPHTADDFDAKLEQAKRQGWVYPHVASPDAVVDHDARQIRLYFHGQLREGAQVSRVATSPDGIHFEACDEVLSTSYLRVIELFDVAEPGWYGMSMPGILYRSGDGLCGFERGPQLFPDTMRHCALLRRGETLYVFWTIAGDAPERIYVSPIALDGDWRSWTAGERRELLRPVYGWEGANLPIAPSVRGYAPHPVHELRDPAVFEDDGEAYLLYTVQGERGIAIALLDRIDQC